MDKAAASRRSDCELDGPQPIDATGDGIGRADGATLLRAVEDRLRLLADEMAGEMAGEMAAEGRAAHPDSAAQRWLVSVRDSVDALEHLRATWARLAADGVSSTT